MPKKKALVATGNSMLTIAPLSRSPDGAPIGERGGGHHRLSRDVLHDQMRAGGLVYLKIGRRRISTRQYLEASSRGPHHEPITLPIRPV